MEDFSGCRPIVTAQGAFVGLCFRPTDKQEDFSRELREDLKNEEAGILPEKGRIIFTDARGRKLIFALPDEYLEVVKELLSDERMEIRAAGYPRSGFKIIRQFAEDDGSRGEPFKQI